MILAALPIASQRAIYGKVNYKKESFALEKLKMYCVSNLAAYRWEMFFSFPPNSGHLYISEGCVEGLQFQSSTVQITELLID